MSHITVTGNATVAGGNIYINDEEVTIELGDTAAIIQRKINEAEARALAFVPLGGYARVQLVRIPPSLESDLIVQRAFERATRGRA